MTHIDFAMTTLLNGICQGTILAAGMCILLKLLPRLNSTTRFIVLWLTLIAVAALPTGLVSLRIPTTTAAQRDSLPSRTTNTPVAATFAPVKNQYSKLKAAANRESHSATIPESNGESASHQVSSHPVSSHPVSNHEVSNPRCETRPPGLHRE